MTDPELPDSIAANVAGWTETNAQFTDAEFYDYVTPEWAWKWPAEEIWVARRTAT